MLVFVPVVVLPQCGATVTLDGYAREWTKGRRTLYLIYEAYEPMALTEMKNRLIYVVERDDARRAEDLDARAVGERLEQHRVGRDAMAQQALRGAADHADTIEKLVKEFDIKVAFHDHPKRAKDPNYRLWDPNYLLSVLKGRDARIGSCADTGHWIRSGLQPLECLRILLFERLQVPVQPRQGKPDQLVPANGLVLPKLGSSPSGGGRPCSRRGCGRPTRPRPRRPAG